MFSSPRILFAPLVALGLVAALTQPAHASAIHVEAEAHYPLPSYHEAGAKVVAFFVYIEVAEGWYFDRMQFTGLATQTGRSLDWEGLPKSDLWDGLWYLRMFPDGGGAMGYFGEAIIDSKTPPGVYDRNPQNLNLPSGITASVYNDEGETASAWAALSFTVQGSPPNPPGPVVPEPASALLLGVGLMIPAGAVWLRRRRAA